MVFDCITMNVGGRARASTISGDHDRHHRFNGAPEATASAFGCGDGAVDGVDGGVEEV